MVFQDFPRLLPRPGQLPRELKVKSVIDLSNNDLIRTEKEVEQDLDAKYEDLLGFTFTDCPPWSEEDFVMNLDNKKTEEDAELDGSWRVFLTKEQDLALIRGYERYEDGDYGGILKENKCLESLNIGLLQARMKLFLEELGPGEELVVEEEGPDGEPQVQLKFDSLLLDAGDEFTTLDGENDDFCYECGEHGELICCDTCPRSYHLKCASLDVIPASEYWECPICCDVYAKDFIDNSEYVDEQLSVLQPLISSKILAKSQEKGKIQSGEGFATRGIRSVVLSEDKDFERITKEIEQSKGFQTEKLAKREEQVFKFYTDKLENENNGTANANNNLDKVALPSARDDATKKNVEKDQVRKSSSGKERVREGSENMNEDEEEDEDDDDEVDEDDDEEEEEGDGIEIVHIEESDEDDLEQSNNAINDANGTNDDVEDDEDEGEDDDEMEVDEFESASPSSKKVFVKVESQPDKPVNVLVPRRK